eukprot:SAG11_NODE_31_length_23119_cov_102.800608_6_plen_1824_part_00
MVDAPIAGEYRVLVHIEQAKDLRPKDSDGAQPIVRIEVMGTNARPNFQFTEVQDNPRDVTWDEDKIFSFKIDDPAELAMAKIKFEVFDFNGVSSNELIGAFEYDVMDIWEQQDNDDEYWHRKYKRWVPLMLAGSEKMEPQGFLQQSVTIMSEESADPPEKDDEGDDDNMQVDAMPNMEQESWQLLIHIKKAQHLPAMDLLGTGLDPYVKVEFGDSVRCTRVVMAAELGEGKLREEDENANEDDSGAPERDLREADFNETIAMKISVPKGSSPPSKIVRFSVWDFDEGSDDDRIASYSGVLWEDLADTKKLKWKEPRWINLYGGAPLKSTKNGKLVRKMNRGAVEGTYYRGRLLVAITASPNPSATDSYAGFWEDKDLEKNAGKAWSKREFPEGKVKKAEAPLVEKDQLRHFDAWDNPKDEGKWRPWTMWIHLLSGCSLPVPDGVEARIEFQIGNHCYAAPSKKEVNNRWVHWDELYEDIEISSGGTHTFMALPADPEQLPDLFVNLMDEDRRISFKRFKFGPVPKTGKKEKDKKGAVVDGSWKAEGRVGWNHRMRFDADSNQEDYFASPFGDGGEQLPNAFEHIQSLSEPYPRPVWYSLQNDLFNVMEESYPGDLQLSLAFGATKEAAQRLMPKDIWAEMSTPKVDSDWAFYNVNLNVYQAMNLRASDENGLCDPYVVCYLGQAIDRTDLMTKTRYPCWYQRINGWDSDGQLEEHESGREVKPIKMPAPHWLGAGWGGKLTVMVYDSDNDFIGAKLKGSATQRISKRHNAFGRSLKPEFGKDSFLGRISFNVEQIMEDEEMANPKWYPLERTSTKTGKPFSLKEGKLKPGEDSAANGKLLLSCSIAKIPEKPNPQARKKKKRVQDTKVAGPDLFTRLTDKFVGGSSDEVLAKQAKRMPVDIKFYILGCRDLPDGCIKPFVKFTAPKVERKSDPDEELIDEDATEYRTQVGGTKPIYAENEAHEKDLKNPTFGEVVNIPADLASVEPFKEADVLQAFVMCDGGPLSFGEPQQLGVVTIPLTAPHHDSEDIDEAELDSSVVGEGWSKLRDAYDCGLEATGTFESPFHTWDITSGSANEEAGGKSKGPTIVGKLKGFFRIIKKPVICEAKEVIGEKKNGSLAYSTCTEHASYVFKDSVLKIDHYRCAKHKAELETQLDEFLSDLKEKKIQPRQKVSESQWETWEHEEGTPLRFFEASSSRPEPLPIELKKFTSPQDVVVRCYVIRGAQLTPADPDGSADPWSRCSLGNLEPQGTDEDHIEDSIFPNFRKAYEFKTKMPGCGGLKVEVLDYDDFTGPDMIGQTVVDLEDRWFSKAWNAVGVKSCGDILKVLWHKMADATVEQYRLQQKLKDAEKDGVDEKRKTALKKRLDKHLQDKVAKYLIKRRALFKMLAEMLREIMIPGDDLEVLREQFSIVDKGGDKAIDDREFNDLLVNISKHRHEGWYQRWFGSTMDFTDPVAVKKIFDDIDIDKSGTVSYGEYYDWVVAEGSSAAKLDRLLLARGLVPGIVDYVKELFKSAVRDAEEGSDKPLQELEGDEKRLRTTAMFEDLKQKFIKVTKPPKKNEPPGPPTVRQTFKDQLDEQHFAWLKAIGLAEKALESILGEELPTETEPEPELEEEEEEEGEGEDEEFVQESEAEERSVIDLLIRWKLREARRIAAKVHPDREENFWKSRSAKLKRDETNMAEWFETERAALEKKIQVEMSKEPADQQLTVLTMLQPEHFKLSMETRVVITRGELQHYLDGLFAGHDAATRESKAAPLKDLFSALCKKIPNMLTIAEATAIFKAFMNSCHRMHLIDPLRGGVDRSGIPIEERPTLEEDLKLYCAI